MTQLTNAALNRTDSVLSELERINNSLDTQLRVLGIFPEHKDLSDKILTTQVMLCLAIVKARQDLATETR